jgi:hypothetical protein
VKKTSKCLTANRIMQKTKKEDFMKKAYVMFFSLLFVLAFSAAVFAFDESLSGGPARLAAMGNQEIVVEDNATIIDLTSLGFSSAIFTRPAGSVIYLYPELDLFTNHTKDAFSGDTDDTTYYGIGTGASGVNNGLVFDISKDTVLTIKPALSVLPGSEKITAGTNNFMVYVPSGELSLAQRFSSNFSAALTGGYIMGAYNTKYVDGETDDRDMDKLEYDLSLSLLPDTESGWTFGLSAGNKTAAELIPQILEYDMGAQNIFLASELPLYLFSTREDDKYSSLGQEQEYWYNDNASGFDISLGAASASSSPVNVGIKAGLLAGISIQEEVKSALNGTTVSDTKTTVFSSGKGTDSELDLRTRLNGADVGLKGVIDFVSGDEPGGGTLGVTYGKGVAGVNFGGKGFMVPVELFYEIISEYEKNGSIEDTDGLYDFGARIGNEIGLSDTLSLRYGIDYTLLASYYTDKTNGTITDQSSATGSQANPWDMQIGYNVGLGFKSQSNEVNLGIRIIPQWSSPKDTDYSGFSTWDFRLVTDMKFFL